MATLAQHELNARSSNDALLLNSGLFGTHARSSSFSTQLSGRFYKNSTLAAHAARKKRAARMRAKKRELEQAILLEERRAELLEERLRKRKEQCLKIQRKRQEAALDIQCWIRQRFATQKVDGMRRYQAAMNQISVFCQARYRGLKGREIAHARRREVAQQRREHEAAIQIQCRIRSRAARKVAESKRKELEKRRYTGVCTIQAAVRMRQCRRRYIERLQEKQRLLLKCREEACTKIQSIHRRNIALQEADRYRAAKQRAAEEKPDPKPKRVPLHMRRYSTYSVAQGASIASIDRSRRRSSVIGLTAPSTSKQQRRSSCPGVALATPAGTANPWSKASRPLVETSVSEPSASPVAKTDKSKPQPEPQPQPQPNLVEEARQRAAARVHIAKRERKSRNPHEDDRDKARALRTRVASFEEKRRKLISTRKKKNKKQQLSLSVEADQEENTKRDCNGGCPSIETEERSPPQAISSEQCGTCHPCTSSTTVRAVATEQDATSSEAVPGPIFPRNGDGEPKREYTHQKHCQKPQLRENKEPQGREHISAVFETESDAKFDSFSEHEDDLG